MTGDRRCRALKIVVVLGALALAAAVGADAPPSALGRAVEVVLRAHAAGDADALAALAAGEDPDPFLVAEVLCRKAPEAARAFAAATVRPQDARLAAYVAARIAHPPAEDEVARLVAAFDAHARQAWPALSAQAPGEGATVVDAALGLWRAEALRAQGEDEADRWLGPARRARAFGWLQAAREGLYRGALAARAADQLDDALAAFAELAEVERARKQDSRAAQAEFFVGSLYVERGQYAQALPHLERARTAQEVLGEAEAVARTLWILARVCHDQGEYGRALVHTDRGLELTRRPDRRARLVEEGAGVYLALGQFDSATERYEAALALVRTLGHPDWTAEVLGNLALARIQLRQYPQAEAALNEALTVFETAEDRRGIATARVALGHLELERGRPAASLRLCQDALAVARGIDNPWLVANITHSVGAALQALGEHAEAIPAFEQTVTQARELGARGTQRDGWLGLAESRLALGQVQAALDAGRSGIALVGDMVGGLAEGQDAEARAKHARLFEVATEAAARLDDASAMAEVVEAGRAMALLASLEGRTALRRQAIPAAHQAEEAEARAAVAKAQTLLEREIRSRRLPEARTRRKALRDAQAQLDAVIARIRRAARQRVSLVYPQADDLETLQGRLTPEEALVLYAEGPEAMYALVVDAKRARIVALGTRTALDTAGAAGAEAAARPDGQADGPLAAFGKLAVQALGLPKSVRRVFVSPTGRLFLAPLPAAFEGREVVYVPSGTTYGVLAAVQPQPGAKVLALGGVDYGDRPRLAALPGSAVEAEHVGDTVLRGPAATEAGLRQALAKQPHWRAVHFACHGLLDMQRPMHSALALTRAAPDDGELTVEEIFGLELSADLVALSACESGRGRIYRAEGIVGLTRGFMHAGAPRVLCSLWKVDDEATRALMEAFYAAWKSGPGVTAAQALQRAQAAVRGESKWSHPYYWAAWVLWGLP